MNKELLIPAGIIILSIALLDPFMVLIPATLVYVLLALLLVISLSYSLLVWHETVSDEREYVLRAYAGRMSFIVGVGVLVLGIVYQTLVSHYVDPFLIITLSLMTLAKYFSYRHAQENH